jgi:hypothetical protein
VAGRPAIKKTTTNTGTATSETAGGAATGQPVIRRERRLTWPRLRYIVTGDRGAVEYMTLLVTGFPLAISYHSPRPLDGVRPVPCDLLGGPCYVDGRLPAPGSYANAGGRRARTTRSSGAPWKKDTPGGREARGQPEHTRWLRPARRSSCCCATAASRPPSASSPGTRAAARTAAPTTTACACATASPSASSAAPQAGSAAGAAALAVEEGEGR